MGSISKEEEEAEPQPMNSTPRLPVLSIQFQIPVSHDDDESPEHSGPPLHTSASVPFRWEEQPGKPRPCTNLITLSHSHQDPHSNYTPKCLELPPRLQPPPPDPIPTKMMNKTSSSSPTTVLDSSSLFQFQSSSFRFTTTRPTRRERQGSFGSSCESPTLEGGQSNSIVLISSKRISMDEGKGRSLFGSNWRRKTHKRGKSEVGGGGVFSSSVDLPGSDVDHDLESAAVGAAAKVKKMSRIARNGSFSSLPQLQVRSHFWATVYKGFKQVLPWKSTNAKRDGLLT